MVTAKRRLWVFIWIGCTTLLVITLVVAANVRVPILFEMDCEFSAVDLELGAQHPADAVTPALPVGEVRLDMVANITVPGDRLAPASQVNQAEVILEVRSDNAPHGAVRIASASTLPANFTIQPIRLDSGGQLKLRSEPGPKSEVQLVMVLTKLTEQIGVVTPSSIVITSIPPSWTQLPGQPHGKPGNSTQVRADTFGTTSLLRVTASSNLLMSVTTKNAADLGNVLSDRVRFSNVAFRMPDLASGRLRSTLTGRPTLRFPSAPDFKVPVGAVADVLVVRSNGGLQFTSANVREHGDISASLSGIASEMRHGTADLRPTLLDLIWSQKTLVMVVTVMLALLGGVANLLDLGEKLKKLFPTQKDHRD